MGIFVRSAAELNRAKAAASSAALAFHVLSIGTMHLAKVEFRAVAVMACDYEIIPLQNESNPSPTTPT